MNLGGGHGKDVFALYTCMEGRGASGGGRSCSIHRTRNEGDAIFQPTDHLRSSREIQYLGIARIR